MHELGAHADLHPNTMASEAQNSPFIKSLASSGVQCYSCKSACMFANRKGRQGNPRPGTRLFTHVPEQPITDLGTRIIEAMERIVLLYAHPS